MSNALPSREVLQQAHPGVAAAAGLLLGRASANKAGDRDGSKLNSQPDQAASNIPVSEERGQDSVGEIPWRQVAGLLHAQGITDPQGLVSPALLLLSILRHCWTTAHPCALTGCHLGRVGVRHT